jgi:hypothetical protein
VLLSVPALVRKANYYIKYSDWFYKGVY